MRYTTTKSLLSVYAAAFSSHSSAFVPSHYHAARNARTTLPIPHSHTHNTKLPIQHQQSRLFFSKRDDDDWSTFKKAGSNLLKKGANKMKSIIPFGKSKEKQAAIRKKERKEQITGPLNEMLKGAPLPIRLMGKMVSPLLAKAAEEIAEQTADMQEMWEDARMRLINSSEVADICGDQLQISQPFSQSQSTTVINGQRSARVQSSFQVVGPKASGVATLESVNGEIRTLNVNVSGRIINVGSIGAGGGRSIYGSKSSSTSKRVDDDNIIEAEIIEKK